MSASGRSAWQQQAFVRMFGVSKSYRSGHYALQDLSLEIERGEFVFLTGPSGAGKTTLLKLLFAAEKPSSGQIVLRGRNIGRLQGRYIPALRRRIGVVFQDFKLLQDRSVEDNVALALEVCGVAPRDIRSRVFRVLKDVGLQDRRKQQVRLLSGGEQQRVALARALVNEPELLLADEPTGNLDPELTLEITQLVMDMSAKGTTVVLATHDTPLVERFAKRVVQLREGRLVADQRSSFV